MPIPSLKWPKRSLWGQEEAAGLGGPNYIPLKPKEGHEEQQVRLSPLTVMPFVHLVWSNTETVHSSSKPKTNFPMAELGTFLCFSGMSWACLRTISSSIPMASKADSGILYVLLPDLQCPKGLR